MFGWCGRLLRVNLTKKNWQFENFEEKILHAFIGGRGTGIALGREELKPGISPLSPENKLIFCTGPLTATGVPTSSRFTCTSISPLTETLFDSNCGGNFGIQMKRCNLDALIIEGQADKPVILCIEGENVELKDGANLWGLTTERIFEALNEKGQVLCIGPAGENLVKFANIQASSYHALGRGGLGAVMGSKNLKAIICRGRANVNVKDREKLKSFVVEMKKWLDANPITSKALPYLGTAGLVNLINEYGMLPVRHWSEGCDANAEKVSGEVLRKFFVREEACGACPIRCGRISGTKECGVKGPEFESLWALGVDCGIFDIEYIIKANKLCNEYGMDTITTGSTIAAAMALHEKYPEFGLKFGDEKSALAMITQIAYRKGVGNELAEGSERFCRKFGGESFSVKGLELPGYDPRGAFGMGLAYATANRGGCHLKGYMIGPEILGIPRFFNRLSFSDKPDILIRVQHTGAVLDSLVLCLFTNFAVSDGYYARLLSAVTGIEYSAEELQKTGERIWNAERLWNVRAGKGIDALPETLLKKPLSHGNSKGNVVPLHEMLARYYSIRKWDSKGVPTEEKLRTLGLD
ncbi:MAG: aldehyde ferredoxin oxidoreductase family protein [Thermoplasmata archaeon]